MLVEPHKPLSSEEIINRIKQTRELASLRSINNALSQLVNMENSFTMQIAEVIRRDPALTSRLLRVVNSVFMGLSQKVNDIEEAVIYLGLKQIRELAVATPVIEDFDKLSESIRNANWSLLWQHSIGTAIMTREILVLTDTYFEDDTDYISGLLHNVGKIVIAIAFPEYGESIINYEASSIDELCQLEEYVIGWDHTKIGAYYLKKHGVSDQIVEAVEYQQRPSKAPKHSKISAAIQVANHLVRTIGITGIEKIKCKNRDVIYELPGWKILFGNNIEVSKIEMSSLEPALINLPDIIQGMF